jgi:hypothetical protein
MITTAGLSLTIPGATLDALTARLPVRDGLSLTYGQLIALGGDFFGDPEQPICTANDPVAQFEHNFEMIQSDLGAEQARKILNITNQYEFQPIAARINAGESPSGAYASIPHTMSPLMNDEDEEFDEATGGGGPGSPRFGRYTHLAGTNLDHFGRDAVTAYLAGHTYAQTTAAEAGATKDQAKLLLAYAQNAFADHFLTDLFAAGHLRTPRRRLYKTAWTDVTRAAAGLCAKGMHDEDNKFGIWVQNAQGDQWVAYGDARYRDMCNSANRQVMKGALQQSMNDIWNAYSTGKVVKDGDCQVLAFLPSVIWDVEDPSKAPGVRDDSRNWAPLFWWDPTAETVSRRDELGDISDREYIAQGIWPGDWGLSTTARDLFVRPGPYMPASEYSSMHIPYPPNEGLTGELGWPPQPPSVGGPLRPMQGATGPDLGNVVWCIDGAAGPTAG